MRSDFFWIHRFLAVFACFVLLSATLVAERYQIVDIKYDITGKREAFDNSVYEVEKKQLSYMLCVTNMFLHWFYVPRIYHENSLLKNVLDYTEKDKFDVILITPPYGGNEKDDVKNHSLP